jgi:scyllo-inositol 2-dehydrogenase (NADP+)
VGYGYAGAVLHPALLQAVDGFALRAVMARDAVRRRAAEERHELRAYASIEALLEDPAVELVVVATPHDAHEEAVVRALAAGRHVVCEKVMALSLAAADRMVAAAAHSGTLLAVFHNRRWDGDYATIQRLVRAGTLGSLRWVEIAIHTHKTPRTWRNDPERCGGLFYDWGAHLVDQALQLVPGRAEGVSGFSIWSGGKPGVGRELFARCQIRFDSGQWASLEVSYASRIGKPHWFVVGDRGTLCKDGLDPQEAAIRRGCLADAAEDPGQRARVRAELDGLLVDMLVDTVPGRWTAFYENVRDAIRANAALEASAAQGRDVVAVLEAHARAVRTNTEVSVQTRTGGAQGV